MFGLFFLLLLLQRHSFVPLVSFYLENRANHRDQTSQKSPESSSSSIHWNSHATLTRGLEVSIGFYRRPVTPYSRMVVTELTRHLYSFIPHPFVWKLIQDKKTEKWEREKWQKGEDPPFATWCANVLDWNVYNKSARLHRVTHKGRERINRNKRSAWPSNEWWTRRRNGAWTWSHARTLIVNTYISVRMQRHDLASTGLKEKQSTII